MKTEFIELLVGRGLSSDLAGRIAACFADWEALSGAESSFLAKQFSPAELDLIRRAKERREIPRATVKRLIEECEFKCCLCWSLDSDSGVVIHHIRAHATVPDDRYENLVVLCVDHHDKVHTKRELTRNPFPPELLSRKKEDFEAAIAAFRAGKRSAPGRERDLEEGGLVSPPLPSPHFVGRDELFQDISNVLESQNGKAAVVGMGGSGKTALALKIAERYRCLFPSGVLWADVGASSGGVPELVREWIGALGGNSVGMEAKEQLAFFCALLMKRTGNHGRLLILVDDVSERILSDLVDLVKYLPPEVSVLLTTREATVASSVGANQFRIESLARPESRRLLESLSKSSLVVREDSSVDELLSLLGDLPLAIELVARQISVRGQKPDFTIGSLCRRLENFDPKLLSFPGHRGISMSFALSYEYLNELEKQVFRSLGVFASTLLFVGDVAAIAGKGGELIEETLDRLVIVSMLNWGADGCDYRLHPLLLKYAEFLFCQEDESERRATTARFYRHYTAAAESVAERSPRDLPIIDRMLANLVKAIHNAAAVADHAVVANTVVGLCVMMGFFVSRNLDRESIPLLGMAISSAKNLGDRDCESACTGHLGSAYSRIGKIREAIGCFERAIEVAKDVGNDYDLASHLQNLATTLFSEAKDPRRIERLLHEALDAAERSQNPEVVIGSLSTLGMLHRDVGKLEEAARLYEGALKASRLAGNRLLEGNNLSNLGLVNDQLGKHEVGEQMIREALKIAVELGDRRGEGNRNGHRGGILFSKARQLPHGVERSVTLASARELILTALRFAQETGDAEKAGTWEMNLGNVSIFSGRGVEGFSQYENALGIAKAGGFARLEAQVRYNLGLALAPLGPFQAKEALKHFRSSSALLKKMGSPMAATAESCISELERALAVWRHNR